MPLKQTIPFLGISSHPWVEGYMYKNVYLISFWTAKDEKQPKYPDGYLEVNMNGLDLCLNMTRFCKHVIFKMHSASHTNNIVHL